MQQVQQPQQAQQPQQSQQSQQPQQQPDAPEQEVVSAPKPRAAKACAPKRNVKSSPVVQHAPLDDRSGEGSIPWSEFASDGEGISIQPADAEEEAEMARRRAERGEKRFNSISDELKAINSGELDPMQASTVAKVDTRQPCAHCGRKFLPERLGRHIKVCEDLKRGKEWRGTWKSPNTSENQLLTSSFKV